MHVCRGLILLAAGCVLIGCPGCLLLAVPVNEPLPLEPQASPLRDLPGAVLELPEGETDVYWLAVERQSRPGSVGGFISPLEEHNGGLVLLFDGASTLNRAGPVGSARDFYEQFGADFRDAGFLTWALVLPEGDTPFGGEDLADALEVLDWLDRDGRAALDVDRIYLVGYSAGASVINLVNIRRDVTAVVSIAGFSEPDQFEELRNLYLLLSFLFPANTAFSQLGMTVLTLDSLQEREKLDVAGRVTEIRNPTLFVHGTDDRVVFVENTRAIEASYQEALAAGASDLPELEFRYIEGGDHYMTLHDPAVRRLALDYLLRFEPDAADVP